MSAGGDNRVAIIGAGVAGLVTAKVLRRDGFDVTVFDKASTVGGVWAQSRAYPGLRTNNPRETYAFSDFDHPASTDDFPEAGQVRGYLESYAEHFGLGPHVRLRTEVVAVSRHPAATDGAHPGFEVTVRPVDASTGAEVDDFAFVVVCNGVFSQPHVPQLDGRDDFAGAVLHSSQFNDPDRVRGKRVVTVGAGKSALDCATFAAHEAASSTLVFRKPHWMLPRWFGRTRVDRVLFNRFSEKIFPAYHAATGRERAWRLAATPLLWMWRRAVDRIVRRISRIPEEMVPEVPVIHGLENNGIGPEFYRVLERGQASTRRAGISRYSSADRVQLDTGEEIEADVVIFATGWHQDIPFLDPELQQQVRREDWFQLYRHILPPEEPRLGFVGWASSGNAPLTSEIATHWLSQHFRGELTVPDVPAMEREIDRVRRWTQRAFPRRSEGYFIGAYVGSYIDQLMRDMGLPTRRAGNFFAEYLGPFWARRYRDVEDERRRLRETRA